MVADTKITEFKAVIQDATLSDENAERLFDAAANTYNIFGCEVPEMSGTAGSKTVTYTAPQKGAVFQGARIIYASLYKNAAKNPSGSIGQVAFSSADLMSNSTVWGMLKDIAMELKKAKSERPRIAFRLGIGT